MDESCPVETKSCSSDVSPHPPDVPPKLGGYEFFRRIGSPQFFLAPMVEHSELAFRMLVRKYGTTCCWGPMLHSGQFATSRQYRAVSWSTSPEDRPLFAQFCGNNPDVMLDAAKFVEKDVDAVDINFGAPAGCPQGIARRGHYGAFLQEELPLCCELVSKLHRNLSVPVTAKMRIHRSALDTIAFARGVVMSGVQVLTVHGRLRDAAGMQNDPSWDMIRRVRDAIPDVPVIGNGGVRTLAEARQRMRETGVDGVAVGLGILHNPTMFADPPLQPPRTALQMAEEYLQFAYRYDAGSKCVKAHLFKLLLRILNRNVDLRTMLGSSVSLEQHEAIFRELQQRVESGQPAVLELPAELVPVKKRKRPKSEGEQHGSNAALSSETSENAK